MRAHLAGRLTFGCPFCERSGALLSRGGVSHSDNRVAECGCGHGIVNLLEGGHNAELNVARGEGAEKIFDRINSLWCDGFSAVEISGVSIDAFECCFGQVIAEEPGLADAIEPGGFDGNDGCA